MKNATQILALNSPFYYAAFWEWHNVMGFGLGPGDDFMLAYCAGGEL